METNRLVHVLFDLTENLEGFIPKIDQKQPSNVVNLAYAFEGLNPILEELEAQGQAVLAQRLEKHYQQHLAQAQVLDQHIQETPNDGDLLRCDAAALELGVRHVVSWLANSCMKLGAAKEQQPATFNNQASVQDFTNLIREIVQASGVGQAPMSSYLRGQIKKAHNLGCSLNPCLLISEKHDPKKSHSECSIREIDPPTDEAGKRSHYLRWATDILCHHFQGRAIQDDEKDSLSKIADALDGGKTLVDEAAPLGQRTPAGQPPSASKPRRRSLKHPATSTQESESTTTNGNNRRSLSPKDEAKILEKCRRRCCICFVLDHDTSEKKGQLAHFDHDRSNNAVSNFVYLCLPHHDTYDSKTSQAKT